MPPRLMSCLSPSLKKASSSYPLPGQTHCLHTFVTRVDALCDEKATRLCWGSIGDPDLGHVWREAEWLVPRP